MTDLSIPNAFTAATTIVAADVNENFDEIETLINTTGVPKVQADAVTAAGIADGAIDAAAKIADGIITHAKMDSKTLGQQVSGGYAELTSTVTADGDKMNITVTGDGATPMVLSFRCVSASTNTSGLPFQALVYDGAGASGTLYGRVSITPPAANAPMNANFDFAVPAFSGSKTFYLSINGSSATPTVTAAAATPATFRATWAPGYST